MAPALVKVRDEFVAEEVVGEQSVLQEASETTSEGAQLLSRRASEAISKRQFNLNISLDPKYICFIKTGVPYELLCA